MIGINLELLGEFVPSISENVPVSIEDAFFAADPLSCKRAFTDFAAFFLCHSSHNGQPQFTITVKSPNVIIYKIDFNPHGGKLTDTDQSIYRISGEAANLASDNQIEFMLFGIFHHLHKGIPLIDLSSGNTLVNVAVDNIPLRMKSSNIIIPLHLILKGFDLGLVFC